MTRPRSTDPAVVWREAMCAAAEVMHAQTTKAQREKRRLYMASASAYTTGVAKPTVERSGAAYPVDDPRWWVEDRYCHDLRVTLELCGDLPRNLVLRFTGGFVFNTAHMNYPFLYWESGDEFRADLITVLRAELNARELF